MYRKCVTVQPCQVENNHTTGIKMKTFIYCLILVMCSSVHTKSSVQTGTQNKESWIVSLQLIRADTTTGNKVLGLKSPYQLDPFKSRSSSPVCERNLLQTWACACFVQSNTEPAWSLLENSARNRSGQPLPGHPQHREATSPGGDLILKQISVCSMII